MSGWGTGGTITGVGEVIKLARPDTQIIAAEPAAAPLLSGKEWAPHKIQGWTPDFVPGVLNKNAIDDILEIPDDGAIETAQALASQEGIFCGISGGGTMWAAIEMAKRAPANSTILAMIPDTGERYLSTPLFADISEESDDKWLNSL